MNESVIEAQRIAAMEMKQREGKGGKSEGGDDDDDDQENNKDMKLFKNKRNLSHQKGFNANKSFARKRKRV